MQTKVHFSLWTLGSVFMKEIKYVNESYVTSQTIIIIEIFNSVDFKSTTCSNYLRPSQNFWFLMEER